MNKSEITNPDRGKTLVLVLILVNTVLVAAISALQVDATIRGNQANRDSQYYAAQVDGSIIQTGHQADYEINTYSIFLNTTLEAQAAKQNALLREAGNLQGVDFLVLESQIYQAQADQAKTLSILMTDPAYAPASDQELPDISKFSSDLNSAGMDLVQKQNDASDAYYRWNNKSDSYVAILTVLAIAFFLLGVAQMTKPGMRSLFTSIAMGVISIGILWALSLLIF